VVGKYQSDRLSLEIRRLRELIGKLQETDEKSISEPLTRCGALLQQLVEVIQTNAYPETVGTEDFATEK